MERFVAIAVLLLVAPAWARGSAPDFDREIRPIFETHCYECHGANKAEGGLRLTSRERAFAAGDYGVPVIVPGDAELSHLYERVTEADPEERMPHKRAPLSPAELDRLRRWIDDGAEWPDGPARHWAYVAPTRPEVPGDGHPVDAFLRARLASEGISPSMRADPARLLRRLHLDLVGLPPTPEQVEAFVRDPSDERYRTIVEELLASPHFGERWAVPWLDLARYSDSNGFQKDGIRDTWAYRDWVVEAINRDLPYDQFTIEQVAGDLLPAATRDQRVATGFHRAATVNIEVGVDPEEDRLRQITDRLNTTATVWLGTSLECAQCHDHKFDPFTQREYYELFAYLNNSPPDVEQVGAKGVTYKVAGPTVELPDPPARRTRREAIDSALAREQQRLAATDRRTAFDAWRDRMRAAIQQPVRWEVARVRAVESTGAEEAVVTTDGTIEMHGPVPDTVDHVVEFSGPTARVTAVRVDSLARDPKAAAAAGARAFRGLPMLSEVSLGAASADPRRAPEEIPIWIVQPPPDKRLAYLWLTLDGRSTTSWTLRSPPVFYLDPMPGDTRYRLTLSQSYGFGRTLDRYRVMVTDAPHERLALPLAIEAILRTETPSRAQEEELFGYFSTRGLEAASPIHVLRQQSFRLGPQTSLVMAELDQPRETHLLVRGSYLDPGERVEAATPASLHPMPAGAPPDRLGLARWLVDPANPLVARVAVNRWWAALFGEGIVRTPEDFGIRGARPSHPELLDWLAVEFMESGWSRKHMIRLLVTSEAYRQSSQTTPGSMERDPENVLLARQSRRRLDAEFIRDQALSVSGLLSAEVGGPPAFPPQPLGVWRHVGGGAGGYPTSRGADRFRRGIYTVHRRSAPYPSFVQFDGPDRTTCTVRRSRTSTPLQALTLLNDEAFIEATLAFAARILEETEGQSADDRLAYAIRLAVSRAPRAEEISLLASLLRAERGRLETDPDAARALIDGVEGYVPPRELDPIELAAWYSVASALLNLDETIHRS